MERRVIMADKKLLTIAIPTYNRCSVLAETVGNFISQITENNLSGLVEIIISDNCSEDDTYRYLKKINDLYDFVIINRNDSNIGFGGNFAKLQSLSGGTYIWFCGDDDKYENGIIAGIVNILRQENPDFCYVNYDSDPEGIAVKLDIDKKVNSLKEFLEISKTACGFMSCCIFKNEIIKTLTSQSSNWPHYEWLLNYPQNAGFYISSKAWVHLYRPERGNWWTDRKNVLFILHDIFITILKTSLDPITKFKFLRMYKHSYKKELFRCLRKGFLTKDDSQRLIKQFQDCNIYIYIYRIYCWACI